MPSEGEGAGLAYCMHCKKLTPRTELEEFIKKSDKLGTAVYSRSKCAICGKKQLVSMKKTMEGTKQDSQWKFVVSSPAKHEVMQYRTGQVAQSLGVTRSRVCEMAIERFLYGEDGNWMEDPLVEEEIRKQESEAKNPDASSDGVAE